MFNRFIILSLVAIQCLRANELLDIFYLTFEEEETWSSITVNFQSTGQTLPYEGQVFYDISSHGGRAASYAHRAIGRTKSFPGTYDRTVHHVKLNNLRPNTTYYFVVGSYRLGFSEEMKFRTLPNDSSPITMVVGGDMGTAQRIVDTSRDAISLEPDVILIGGDIAYANGFVSMGHKWVEWFARMKEISTTPSGYLIPWIVAIGNHEVLPGTTLPVAPVIGIKRAPWYFLFFSQRSRRDREERGGHITYFTKKLGNHTALVVLDSGHYASHGGVQRAWLEGQLNTYKDLPNRLALYHAPLFPGNRRPSNFLAAQGRASWLDLFGRYQVAVAFEHHDHVLKRTFPLKGVTKAQKGTVYLGDGSWGGRSIRNAHPARWYLDMASEDHHVWLVRVMVNDIRAMASGADGQVFDYINILNSPTETVVKDLLKR